MSRSLVDLRTFLDVLRREGELIEIDAPVDPDLEAAEVHRRCIAACGPALLFRDVKGSPWPCVTNLFGTQRRVELAFGKRPLELVEPAATSPYQSCTQPPKEFPLEVFIKIVHEKVEIAQITEHGIIQI